MVIVMYLEFDQRVNESRIEAENALEKVAEIQESITVAEKKTGTAIEEIKDLEEIATSALFLAESAYNVTLQATKVSCPFAFFIADQWSNWSFIVPNYLCFCFSYRQRQLTKFQPEVFGYFREMLPFYSSFSLI